MASDLTRSYNAKYWSAITARDTLTKEIEKLEKKLNSLKKQSADIEYPDIMTDFIEPLAWEVSGITGMSYKVAGPLESHNNEEWYLIRLVGLNITEKQLFVKPGLNEYQNTILFYNDLDTEEIIPIPDGYETVAALFTPV